MEALQTVVVVIGIISFAAAGAMVAIDKETDAFGVIFLSLITCFGGGLLRDCIFSDMLPVFFSLYLEISVCVLTALAVFIIASVYKKRYVKDEARVMAINNILDALGLGVFVSQGTGMYLEKGAFVAIVAGFLSAVGGSIVRDVMLRDIPFILRKRIYAFAALVGAGAYYCVAELFMKDSEAASIVATVVCVALVFGIRMCATVFRWDMPVAIRFSKINASIDQEKTKV